MKLDPVFKEEWLKALRSGVYKQGQMSVRPTKDTYCCLGVLGDICVQHGLAKWHELSDYAGGPMEFSLSEDQWDGVTELSEDLNNKTQLPGKESAILQGMNDGGSTFMEIADYIEANL